MADRSAIEWTDASWNPVRTVRRADGRRGHHCEKVSAGCTNCYAESFNLRLGTKLEYKPGHREAVDIVLDEAALLQPLRWRPPRRIFLGSMTDVFADFVSDATLVAIFAVVAACSRYPLADGHAFQVLTKRPARARSYLADRGLPHRIARAWCTVGRDSNKGWTTLAWTADGEASVPARWPLPNVWLGTSCEDQAAADARVPELLATPAAVRFVSAEPLLGPIDFTRIMLKRSETLAPNVTFDALRGWMGGFEDDFTRLDWIIVGGESGPGARPMHSAWAEAIRDQCAAVGTAFFFKQWGEWVTSDNLPSDRSESGAPLCVHGADFTRLGKKAAGRLLNGATHDAMPEVRHG